MNPDYLKYSIWWSSLFRLCGMTLQPRSLGSQFTFFSTSHSEGAQMDESNLSCELEKQVAVSEFPKVTMRRAPPITDPALRTCHSFYGWKIDLDAIRAAYPDLKVSGLLDVHDVVMEASIELGVRWNVDIFFDVIRLAANYRAFRGKVYEGALSPVPSEEITRLIGEKLGQGWYSIESTWNAVPEFLAKGIY
ncbi:hypothetical protein PENSPDRAFT_755840 [Peniophora sp. CONT]|nr:hypothetical protein PENSPDRAFT_755840 [Peniophora sp. CONT]